METSVRGIFSKKNFSSDKIFPAEEECYLMNKKLPAEKAFSSKNLLTFRKLPLLSKHLFFIF